MVSDELPDAGFFLIASEDIHDSRFKESVILVTRHHRGEAIGVVVNKPTNVEVDTLFPKNSLADKLAKPVYLGGPLAIKNLFFLIHSKHQPKASLRIFDNVYLSNDQKVLTEVLRHPKPFAGIRVFFGYAGWKRGQLESEIEQGSWHLRKADSELLFHSDPDQMWHQLIDNLDQGLWVQQQTKQANS